LFLKKRNKLRGREGGGKGKRDQEGGHVRRFTGLCGLSRKDIDQRNTAVEREGVRRKNRVERRLGKQQRTLGVGKPQGKVGGGWGLGGGGPWGGERGGGGKRIEFEGDACSNLIETKFPLGASG